MAAFHLMNLASGRGLPQFQPTQSGRIQAKYMEITLFRHHQVPLAGTKWKHRFFVGKLVHTGLPRTKLSQECSCVAWRPLSDESRRWAWLTTISANLENFPSKKIGNLHYFSIINCRSLKWLENARISLAKLVHFGLLKVRNFPITYHRIDSTGHIRHRMKLQKWACLIPIPYFYCRDSLLAKKLYCGKFKKGRGLAPT